LFQIKTKRNFEETSNKTSTMKSRIESALNDQVNKEASSSQFYLAMASWAENHG
jgi:ferritin